MEVETAKAADGKHKYSENGGKARHFGARFMLELGRTTAEGACISAPKEELPWICWAEDQAPGTQERTCKCWAPGCPPPQPLAARLEMTKLKAISQ